MTTTGNVNAEIDPKVIERIEKLLRLAKNNPNEAEATSAMAKATELLEAYNLEMSDLGSDVRGKRRDTTKKGGLYTWQRKLWKEVAELNFCYYLSLRGLAKGSQYEHRLIGSHANVVATTVMAEYLQETIEKLAQAWAKREGYGSVFVKDAIAYREGMTERVCGKLQDRRWEIEEEARRAKEEQREKARAEGAPTSNALTILDVISDEADFNNDYLNGWEMGTTARNRAESEARRTASWEEHRRRIAERDADELLHPWKKEARLAAEKRIMDEYNAAEAKRQARRNQAKPRVYRETKEDRKRDSYGFRAGHRDGHQVGIDQQVDRQNTARIG